MVGMQPGPAPWDGDGGMIRTEVDDENPLNAMGWDAVQCSDDATRSNIPGAIGAG